MGRLIVSSALVHGRSALAFTAVVLSLGGCALLRGESCEQFEKNRETTNYATAYRLDKANEQAKPDKNQAASISAYTLTLSTERPRACSHVSMKKEIVLARRDNAVMTFEERRESFAEDGTLIAVKNEVLNPQLLRSGRYSASVPLPIPKSAPPGKYRLSSTLLVRYRGGARPVVLAKATANFEVVAR